MMGEKYSLIVQGSRFVVVGLAQMAVDFAIFVVTLRLGLDIGYANVAGRIAGAASGYLINGSWTFRAGSERMLGGMSLSRYAFAWTVLTLVGTWAVWALSLLGTNPLGAKLLVEGMLAIASFIVMRVWVYSSLRNSG